MANTKYAYVRNFELPDPLLPGTFLVFRVDGHSFHRFSEAHQFAKPNDARALQLMDHAARDIMEVHPDIVLAFGESDEYSFLLKKSTTIYNRRHSKILSTLTSQFTSSYVFHWSKYFPEIALLYPPSFDGRIVLYPTEKEVRDYFSWRQADTHINNLYNTTFWALVQQGGHTTTEAHATLRGTFSKDKNEILFSRFNINYNLLNARFRKGSVLVREELENVELEREDRGIAAQEGSAESTQVSEHQSLDISTEVPPSPSSAPHRPSEDNPAPPAHDTLLYGGSDPPNSAIDNKYGRNIQTPGTSENILVPLMEDSAPRAKSPARHSSKSGPMASKAEPKLHSSLSADTEPQANNNVEDKTNQKLIRQPNIKVKMKPKPKSKPKTTRIELLHCDIIRDDFWTARPGLFTD